MEQRIWRILRLTGLLLGTIFFFSWLYRSLLTPLLLSLMFTYLLLPLVNFFKFWSRSVTIFLLLFLWLAGLSVTVFWLFPLISTEIQKLLSLAPKVIEMVTTSWLPSLKSTLLGLDFFSDDEIESFFQEAGSFSQLSEQFTHTVTGLLSSVPKVVGTLVNFVLVPVMTFFLLRDYQDWKIRFLRLIPTDLQAPFQEFTRDVNQTLWSVIKGQVLVALILGVFYITGFSLLGLQAGATIGLVAGVCRLVPYLDVLVGGALCLISVFSDYHGGSQLVGVLIVFVVIQSLDGMFITPKVIGHRVGLHPLVVILSVIAFADSFGFLGILLAIPIVAVGKVLLEILLPFYFRSQIFRSEHTPPSKL